MKLVNFIFIIVFLFTALESSYASQKWMKRVETDTQLKKNYQFTFELLHEIEVFLRTDKEINDEGLFLSEIFLWDSDARFYYQLSNSKGEISCTIIEEVNKTRLQPKFRPAKRKCPVGSPNQINGSEKWFAAIPIIRDNLKRIWEDMGNFLNQKFKGVFLKPFEEAYSIDLSAEKIKIGEKSIIMEWQLYTSAEEKGKMFDPKCTYEFSLNKKQISKPLINCEGGGL